MCIIRFTHLTSHDTTVVHCYMKASKTRYQSILVLVHWPLAIHSGYKASSTARTTCSCSFDYATYNTMETTMFSVSSSCPGACIMTRYPTDVCHGLTVLKCWLNVVQDYLGFWEERVMVNPMSVAWGFIVDGQSSCKPSYYECSAEWAFESNPIRCLLYQSLCLGWAVPFYWRMWYNPLF